MTLESEIRHQLYRSIPLSVLRETDAVKETGVTPKSLFGILSRTVSIGWKYSAGDGIAQRLEVNELLDRIEQANRCCAAIAPAPSRLIFRVGMGRTQALTHLDLMERVFEASNAHTLALNATHLDLMERVFEASNAHTLA